MARLPLSCPPLALAAAWAVAFALLAPVGCGFKIEKIEDEPEVAVKPLGFDSPQDAFAWLRKSAAEKEYKEMMQAVTDETAQLLAGHMLISGAMATATIDRPRTIRRILSDHGIDDDAMREIQEKLATQIRDPEAIYELGNLIDRKRDFVADIMEAFAGRGNTVPISGFDGEVKRWDIQEEANRAIALIEQPDGKLERVAFLRNDNGWQVHFAVRLAAAAEMQEQDATTAPDNEEVGETPAAETSEKTTGE